MGFTILPRSWAGPLLSLLRIMTGLLFLEDGTGKFFGFPPHLPFISEEPPLLLYFTATMEFFGGILITFGLFTRPAAFVLSGYMAVAYFWMHAPHSFFPAINGGVPAVLFCFVYLYLAAAGPGPWAIDRD
jgi:putative oxidoreductase